MPGQIECQNYILLLVLFPRDLNMEVLFVVVQEPACNENREQAVFNRRSFGEELHLQADQVEADVSSFFIFSSSPP